MKGILWFPSRLLLAIASLFNLPALALTTFEPVASWPLLPTQPSGNELVQHPSNGWLYGTCSNGGAHGYGMLFRMNGTSVEPLVHFTGDAGGFPGEKPIGRLALAPDGNYYGVTAAGGDFFCGTIFRLTPDGVYTLLVEFTGQEEGNVGQGPYDLTLGADGNLYGTTALGGDNNSGTFFKVSTTGVLTTLYHFPGPGGSRVTGRLALGANGNFYGLTYNDGAFGYGTVLMFTPAGARTTLAEFTLNGETNKGAFPVGHLLLHPDGKLYGVTQWGPGSNGTIFSVTAAGEIATLAEFDLDGSQGSSPAFGVTLGVDNKLYGVTGGGDFDFGTLFSMTTNDEDDIQTLLHFTGNGASNKGKHVAGCLTLGADGNLHGMTGGGGAHDKGTIFSITHAGVLTTRLHCTATGSGPEGANPSGKLTRGADGNFYGMTRLGGTFDLGTVFKLTPAGVRTVLLSFSGASGSHLGAHPVGHLLLGADGDFYGMTPEGGTSDLGTIFRMTPEGELTTLVNFTGNGGGNKGSAPKGSLIQAPGGGSFYGTTSAGGALGYGTVFSMTSAGVLSTLLEFTGFDGAAPDVAPCGDLLLGPDNKFYGTTSGEGIGSDGTLFSVTSAGVYATLLNFNVSAGLRGSGPLGALILGNDGRFYGVSSAGGNVYDGAAFAIAPGGEYERLFTFDNQNAVNNGAYPSGTLTLGHDGRVYGTTSAGGAADKGTLFSIRNGKFKTLLDFTGLGAGAEGGAVPVDGRLTAALDGTLYAMTQQGGTDGGGTVFRMIMGPEMTVAQPAITPLESNDEREFFQTPVGSGAQIIFTITNTGLQDLENILPALTGPDADAFSLVSLPQGTLSPGANTTFILRFEPSALGAHSAVLEISSNDADFDPFVVNLSGTGVAPISFSAATYTVNHGVSQVVVTLTRPIGTEAGSVTLQTTDGTASKVPPFSAAIAGKDYTAVDIDVQFDVGETTKQISIPLNSNSSSAANKRFIANIFDPQGAAALGAITAATIEILASDTTKPTVTITAPVAKASDLSPFMARGMTGDAKGIDRVEVALNGNPLGNAVLGASNSPTSIPWSLAITPLEGANTLTVTSFDARGNFTNATRAFTFVRRYTLTLTRNNPSAGTVDLSAKLASGATALAPSAAAANPKTSLVVPGTVVTLTAKPKTGFVFSDWDNLPGNSVGNTTTFIMPANNVAITANFMATPFNPPSGRLNTFLGLLHPSGPPSTNANEGLLNGTLTATGSFTGKLFVDGVAQSITATFFGDGSAILKSGSTWQNSLTFGGRVLTLAFDFDDAAVTASLVNGASTSTGDATRPLYSTVSKVPVAFLSSPKATKGFYTIVFPSKDQVPPVAATAYPQGHGFATLSLTNSGGVSLTGTLADGIGIMASSSLLGGNLAPFLVQLPTPGAASVKAGSFSGTLAFEILADSDVSALDLLWFRPPAVGTTAATHLYTPGWPQGIRVDALGALYNTTTKVQTSLGLPAVDPVNGNGELMFTNGKLTAGITKTNFNINGSTVAKIPSSDGSFMLTLAASTGAFSGTFAPNWSPLAPAKPAFKGIILQKGANKGGYGFFISNAKNDPDPESGSVTLGSP